jgi:lipopolysaccharide transport system permease protein
VKTTVIRPPRRIDRPAFRELWEAREVLLRFGQRDILLRYRQTAIGVVWVVLQPLLAAGIFTIVFGQVAALPSDGVPYFLFSYIGMVAWTFLSNLVTRASGSLVANQALVSKVFFPRALVPLSTILSVLLDLAVAMVLGVVLLVVYRANPGWEVLLAPWWLLQFALLGAGLGLAFSALTVKYRDVTYVLPWLIQIGLYASPVAYALSAVPENVRFFFMVNPVTWLLEGFRFSLLDTPSPPLWQWIAAPVVCLTVAAAGTVVFQRYERTFADLI